ncbi:MAG: 4Fe-4S binding protein [Candidatus Methanomethylicia archaeon]
MTYRLAVIDVERCVGCELCMFACSRRFGEGGLAKSAIAVRSIGGVERGFTVIVCRACPDPPCAKVCIVNALIIRKGGGVILNQYKCIGCGRCVDACPVKAIFWNSEVNKPNICVHCGYCAKYCPHEVLKLEKVV